MIYWFGDLLDRLNGRKYKTGASLPRPSLMDVFRAYERDLSDKPDLERELGRKEYREDR